MSERPMGPVRFREVFKTKVWGGRRLESVLGKRLPADEPVGESWEVSDHDHGMSVVADGPLAGRTLRELVKTQGEALTGRPDALELGGRFPLLYKFLDATDWLSVQVHPTDAWARRRGRGEAGKSEAWFVIHAEPGATIARGLAAGCDRATLAKAIDTGTVGDVLRYVPVRRGDVVSMPAGTVHALGPGIVVAEIQQNSDTTWRVFDWNRVGLDGRPRELHVERALDVIDFDACDDAALATPALLHEAPIRHERLVANEKFTFERYLISKAFEISPRGLRSFVILTCIAGSARVEGQTLDRGQTLLLPGGMERATVAPEGDAELLAMTLPRLEDRS